MLIFLVLVLLIIGTSIMAGVYATVNPFVAQLGNIQRYNQAYYGAIASVERAELVLRGHTAGFEGSGGWIGNTNYGNSSDNSSNIVQEKYFGMLANRNLDYGIFWKITSLDKDGQVPSPGKGNLDPVVSSGNDYYRLDFGKALKFAFYKDVSPSSDYYTGVTDNNLQNIKVDKNITVSIRMPMLLADSYNGSDMDKYFLDKNQNIDLDGDGVLDDIIVNRSISGLSGDTNFTIFPSINLNDAGTAPASDDTAIREDVINGYFNNTGNVVFNTDSGKDTNPINACKPNNTDYPQHEDNVDSFNVSPDDAVNTGFDLLFNTNLADTVANGKSDGKISKLAIKFSLINYLKYDENHVYPYAEIKLVGNANNSIDLPDVNFHIVGEGKVGDYDVKILLSKPVFNTSAASDFTVLF